MSEMESPKLVELRGVSKVYQTGKVRVEALKNIDLTFSKGEFTAIAGPSGSGKTTLLNIIGTLDRPTDGKILFEGEDLTSLSEGELANFRLYKVGFVFQAYNLIPVLTGYENAEFILFLQRIPKEERERRVRELFREFDLLEQWDKFPGEMSGGQQQRVAVARAIAPNPPLVLADEPTANLDSKTGAALLELMQELNEKYQITFVFSTHDPMVMERARRIIRLKDGEIVSVEE